MRRLLASLMVAGVVAAAPTAARAHDAYDDSESHPLRLAAYALHPAGFAVEWLVMRPINFVVSNPNLERIFGHTASESAYGDYRPYRPEELD